MKKSSACMQKSKRTMFGICMCLVAVIAVASIGIASAITTPTPEKEDIINNYISYLSEAGNSAVTRSQSVVFCELPGMGTEDSALPDMTLDEAEEAGVYDFNKPQTYSATAKANHYYSVAEQQHNLVVEQFGEDAWDNVSYKLEEIEPLRGTIGYRVIATGELVNEETYEQIMRDYWDGVAEQEGVSYYDMFLMDEEPSENMENKRVDLIAKYAEGIPAELTTVSDSQTYDVKLTFNGRAVSDDEYENFHFVIDNSGGDWTVFQGLSWLVPYPEFPVAD